MFDPAHPIPTEVYLAFLGRTIPIHWNYHAILMFSIWLLLVPLSVIAMRYCKPRPTRFGIQTPVEITNPDWWWFSLHKYGLYGGVALSLAGLLVALVVSRGFSGSLHAILGLTTICLGTLQALSAWHRGTHGGRYYCKSDPGNPDTWRGDHFDMTPRRRWFEAYHKTSGYCAGFFAIAAVASGLMRYHMPVLTGLFLALCALYVIMCITMEYKGRRYDTYRSVFGNDPEHPHNIARKDL